ncbi:MAG: hypothetical protein ABI895_42750 [Deltaproteobacteria bacterium]
MTTLAPVPHIVDRNEWQRLRQDLLEREKLTCAPETPWLQRAAGCP